MGLPAGTMRTMRHAHCTGTESNSAVQHHHSVTSFLNNWIGKQPIDIIQVEEYCVQAIVVTRIEIVFTFSRQHQKLLQRQDKGFLLEEKFGIPPMRAANQKPLDIHPTSCYALVNTNFPPHTNHRSTSVSGRV